MNGIKLQTLTDLFSGWVGMVPVACDVHEIEFKLAILKADQSQVWESGTTAAGRINRRTPG